MHTSCCVLGLGYIGLPTATLFANGNVRVYGFDTNPEVLNKLSSGSIHIHEPDLQEAFTTAINSGNLSFHAKPQKADVYLIAVPTPIEPASSTSLPQPYIQYVTDAACAIANIADPGSLIILESTSPVGTTEHIQDTITALNPALQDSLLYAYCPERVLPGKILSELISNDRVIGGLTSAASERAASLYSLICEGSITTTDARTAELVKLTENTFRDVNIAFANELSLIADQLGVDVYQTISLANRHPRVNILKPGCGVGGHCIAVDPWFLASSFPDISKLTITARTINNLKPDWVVNKIMMAVDQFQDQFCRQPLVTVYGLTFKPDTDDLRGSPAMAIANSLHQKNLLLQACDPFINSHPNINIIDLKTSLTTTDIGVILVGHSSFNPMHFNGMTVLDFCGFNSALN